MKFLFRLDWPFFWPEAALVSKSLFIDPGPIYFANYEPTDMNYVQKNIQYHTLSVVYPATSDQSPMTSCQRPVTRKQRPQTNACGFTLMEILLAFLILGIVVTTILASFNAVFSSTDALKNSTLYFDMAKNCMSRMKLDLEALYVSERPFYKPPEFDDPPDPYRIVGSNTDTGGTSFAEIRFTSRAHIPLNKSIREGIAEIVYYVQAKNDGRLVLKRADHLYPYPPFEKQGADPILCEHVKSLAFKYYDSEGAESEEWNSDSEEYGHATPAAIGIQLEIGNESASYTFETTVRLAVHRKSIE